MNIYANLDLAPQVEVLQGDFLPLHDYLKNIFMNPEIAFHIHFHAHV